MSLLPGSAIESGGYTVDNSIRVRYDAYAYLNRTPASAGNRKTFTWSSWVKRGLIGNGLWDLYLYAGGISPNPRFQFGLNNSDNFIVQINNGSTWSLAATTAVFRDPSAWYHFVVSVDLTNGTNADRVKVYVNNILYAFASTPTWPTTDQAFNNNVAHYIASTHAVVNSGYASGFDGYIAETHVVDGQALTPSSFGETDTTTGVWKPKAYTGTYGTNGFYLKFSDIATTSGSNAGLGKDFSGNANYWTTNNISVTSGTTYDAMIDSPTNASASGTQPVGNYAVINPIAGSTSGTIDNANLRLYYSGANWSRQISSMGMTSGKWYAEFTISQIGDNSWQTGITSSIPTRNSSNQNGEISGSSFLNAYQSFSGGATIWNNTTRSSLSVTYANNDVIGVAFDADTATVKYYRNGSQVGTTGGYVVNTIESVWYFQMFSKSTDGTGSYGIVDANFGQRPFAYTPPTGYQALCTTNLPTPTILQGNKYMDATTYTGTRATQVVTNAGAFKPDMVWCKGRSFVSQILVSDSVRGTTKQLFTPLTIAEQTDSTFITSFNTNGFTMGDNSGGPYGNINYEIGGTHVAWQWQAGQGTTSSNTQGSITSTVSVSTTAGFSVATYTGNGTAGATIGHSLGIAPKMIIIKKRSSTADWDVYHASLGATKALYLNRTDGQQTDITFWNNTAPTSTVTTFGTSPDINSNGVTYVMYSFAEIAGFSKFGSYTGNGSSDGPFIYLGFRPKFVMIKNTSTGGYNWTILDTARDTYNYAHYELYPNTSGAEVNASSSYTEDILSNGFKIRQTDATWNANGSTYAYMAFAETPFKNSLAR